MGGNGGMEQFAEELGFDSLDELRASVASTDWTKAGPPGCVVLLMKSDFNAQLQGSRLEENARIICAVVEKFVCHCLSGLKTVSNDSELARIGLHVQFNLTASEMMAGVHDVEPASTLFSFNLMVDTNRFLSDEQVVEKLKEWVANNQTVPKEVLREGIPIVLKHACDFAFLHCLQKSWEVMGGEISSVFLNAAGNKGIRDCTQVVKDPQKALPAFLLENTKGFPFVLDSSQLPGEVRCLGEARPDPFFF